MISNPKAVSIFQDTFQSNPMWVSRAPGRVNLIGEHTDYNGGFVLPAAISHNVTILASKTNNYESRLHSVMFNDSWKGTLGAQTNSPRPGKWPNYFLAVVAEFQKLGHRVPELDVLVDGNVPAGAGLSSSAAFEVAAAVLLNDILQAGLSKKELIHLAQRAENGPFVGVNCGIMDQYASAFGEKDKVILLDCHYNEHELVSFDSSKISILIINSMKKRGLVDSQYNKRRQQCQNGHAELEKLSGEKYTSIRHIPLEVFNEYSGRLEPDVAKRIRHNLTENQRVLRFSEILEREEGPNPDQLGGLLYASHESLRQDFEVSCNELDTIVNIARKIEGIYGCRMTGAGFGGCCMALIEPDKSEQIIEKVKADYHQSTGKIPECYLSVPDSGALAEKVM